MGAMRGLASSGIIKKKKNMINPKEVKGDKRWDK